MQVDGDRWILSQDDLDTINQIHREFSQHRDAVLEVKRLETLYMYLTGVGIIIDRNGIRRFDEMIGDAEQTKNLVLTGSISIFDQFPQCFTNRMLYPRAVRLVYPKASHRVPVINEYERFLDEVLAVKNGDYNYLSLAYVAKLDKETFRFDNQLVTNERPEYKLAIYLEDLGEMYLSEYRYDDVRTIIDWHRRNRVASFAYKLAPEYFRRTHRFDEGARYFEECLDEFPKKDEERFRGAIEWMHNWKQFKPYKPRPKKNEPFVGDMIRLP